MEKLIRENRITKEELLADESIFSLANGFLGTRGTFAEGYGSEIDFNQTYLNGFYDYYDYFYEENLTGFPQRGQKFINLIDGNKMEFIVNGKPLNMSNCEVVSLKREYDLESGMTIRIIQYKTTEDYEFKITEKKIVSNRFKDLIASSINIKSLNYDGKLTVKSYLQESIKNKPKKIDPRVYAGDVIRLKISKVSITDMEISSSTLNSNLSMVSKILHNVDFSYEKYDNKIVGKREYSISKNESVNIVKYITHVSSLYHDDYILKSEELSNTLKQVTFDDLIVFQKEYFKTFWNNSYIKVKSNSNIEALLNYNLYQLNSSGGESPLHNISAKGLSGDGYEGHYFWDTEIYLIPYFILTNPQKAKNLLMYRYNNLDKARGEAKNLGYSKGAKIPWRTINGDETSPYYPAGSAQFHINSDVSYAVIKYFEVTNDLDFMINYGFEILLETARFLNEALNCIDGVYHLFGVTGPDEYTTVINDNYYTNSLLKYHFKYTYEFYFKNIKKLHKVINNLEVLDEEINHLLEVSDNIHLPFDTELNIFAQDASFLSKKKLDLKNISKDKFPLLLHYHPLFLYKHQVLKQADAILSMVLLDHVGENIFRDSFNYYEPITTHDSSLSKCIYSIAAFSLNKVDFGFKFYKDVLETDYYDTHKNTSQGLHIANLGGSYLGFIYGILGLRIHENRISLQPRITEEIQGYELNIFFKGSRVSFKIGSTIEIRTENEILFSICDEDVLIKGVYHRKFKK